MTIDNPNIIPRPIVSSTGTLTAASQVELNDNSSVENAVTLTRQGGFIWLFDASTSATDPGPGNFRFDNANIASVTNIYLDKVGENARLDEYISQLISGSYIWLQDILDPSFNVLFSTDAAVGDTGGATGYFTLSVAYQRHVGTLNVTAGRRFRFEFLTIAGAGGGGSGPTNEEIQDLVAGFITAGTGLTKSYDDPGNELTLSLPNNFLAELAETDTNTFPASNRLEVDTPIQLSFIRFWLRSDEVTPANIDNAGTGLRIDEANGDLDNDGPTFSLNTNDDQTRIYFTLPDNYINLPTDLNTLWLVVKDDEGNIVDTVNVGAHATEQTSLSAEAAGMVYLFTSGLNGGSFIHYRANQTLEFFTLTVDQFFEIPQANVDNVDFTRVIKDLTEEQLEGDLQAKINAVNDIPHDDQFKLDQFVEQSTDSAPAALTGSDTIYHKLGAYDTNASEYYTTDFDTGLPPSFDSGGTTWTVVAPHDRTITSFSGLESGSVNADEVDSDVTLNGATGTFNVYRVTIPVQASATNFFVPFGTTRTVTEINPTSLVKIARDNVDPTFLATIENTQNPSTDNLRITALENKVAVIYPLAPDVDALEEWGDIYVPERAVQGVDITEGYSLLADYRGDATHYESASVTYSDAGTNVVTYTGLTSDLRRAFGFKVSGPADQVLMWLVDGANRIPFIDMTAAGNYRINNYTQARTSGTPVENEIIEVAPSQGTDRILAVGVGNAIFEIPAYPSGATVTSRSFNIDVDILVNGVDTEAGHFININVPETEEVRDRAEIRGTANLGPLHGYRHVTFTIDYRFTNPSPGDYRLIVTLQDAPSDVTVSLNDTDLIRSYTPADTVTRTDNFVTFTDPGGDYTFAGENELLVAFLAEPNNRMNAVPVTFDAASQVHELNDRTVPVPVHGFEDVEIPDQTALTGFEFRTFLADHYFRHSELATLIRGNATQWDYGLARLRTVSTTHAVTEPIDLAAGSTIGGVEPTTFDNRQLDVYQATGTGTGAGELVNNVTLPADYTDYDYVIVTEMATGTPNEWRHNTIPTTLLNSGHVADDNDFIRIQGNSDLTWNRTTRVLDVPGVTQTIYLVRLIKVGGFVSS